MSEGTNNSQEVLYIAHAQVRVISTMHWSLELYLSILWSQGNNVLLVVVPYIAIIVLRDHVTRSRPKIMTCDGIFTPQMIQPESTA